MKYLKALLLTSLFIVIAITTTSAKNIETANKNYLIRSFTSIKANTVANIVYTQSDEVSVRVVGIKDMIDSLKIKVRNGILIIENSRELNEKSNEPLIIFLSSPTLNSIETHGLGNWCLKGTLKCDSLEITSDGIGRINALDLQSKKICVNLKGIGNLKLAGKAEFVEIMSNGSGNIDCQNLLSKTTMVRSTKIGKVNCFASESIGLFNNGIGEITFHGNPDIKTVRNGSMGTIKEVK